ncbi:MAG: IPT/TIG domain-containing protein [Myxococcota bacterium]
MSRVRALPFLAFLASLLSLPASASAETLEFFNDSFDTNQSERIVTTQLIAGESYAVTFDIPQNILPVEMLGVRVVMVDGPNFGQNYCGRWSLEVYEERASMLSRIACEFANVLNIDFDYLAPGMEIYNMTRQFMSNIGFVLQGDPNNFQDVLFSTINTNPQLMATIPAVMINTPRIRVVLRALDLDCAGAQGDAFPLMLTDTDGFDKPNTNFVEGTPDITGFMCTPSPTREYYTWDSVSQASITSPKRGDFVMRLLLDRQGSGVMDMGTSEEDMSAVEEDMDGVDMGVMEVDMGTSEEDMSAVEDMGPVEEDMSAVEVDMGSGNAQDMGSGGMAEPLMVSSISPRSTTRDASTEVAILGSSFQPGIEVSLDARKIGVVETRPGRILATVPSGLNIGTYDLILTNPDGESALLPQAFTVVEPMDEGVVVRGDDNAVEDGCAQTHSTRAPTPMAWVLVFAIAVAGLRRRSRREGVRA